MKDVIFKTINVITTWSINDILKMSSPDEVGYENDVILTYSGCNNDCFQYFNKLKFSEVLVTDDQYQK